MSINYKRKELALTKKVQAARNEGPTSLYSIAKSAVELFNGQGEYADQIGIDKKHLAEHINKKFLRDCATTLANLIVVLSIFPDKEQWDKPILDLLEEADKVAASEKEPRRSSPRISRSEYDAVCEELEAAKSELEKLRAQVTELTADNQRLREENIRLSGRAEELDRILSEQLARSVGS